MEEYPQAVIDKVLGELDTHKGLIAFDVETVKLKFRKIEVTVYVASTICRARRKLFQVITKRTEYPAEVYCEAIKSGYRICDTSRSLRSCLLTQCKSSFAKKATAAILEVDEVSTLFKAKS